MFGENWVAGTATIVFAENEAADTLVVGRSSGDKWVYVFEVTPPGQPAFRDKVLGYHHTSSLGGFNVGQAFQMLYEAKRKKIKWDITDPTVAARLPQKQASTQTSKHERLNAALAGSTPPASPAEATAGHLAGPALDVSPEEQLRKLTYIHEHGVISDEQFEEDKAKIVGLES